MIKKLLKLSLRKNLSTSPECSFSILKDKLQELFPKKVERIKQIRKKYSQQNLETITLNEIFNGMSQTPTLYHATSVLDPRLGVIMRGYTFSEIKEFLPKGKENLYDQGLDELAEQPLPESLIWLFLIGEVPTAEEFEQFQTELLERPKKIIDENLLQFIKNLPKDMHPVTQLASAIMYLQPRSLFFEAYARGINKKNYWEYVFEDVINLIAIIPHIGAYVYRHNYENDNFIAPDYSQDWAANFVHMMGINQDLPSLEAMRCYLSIMSEHDGGNVATHTTHLVGSALADPYLAYSAGINGLAGQLNGLADQDFWRFINKIQNDLGKNPSDQLLQDFLIDYINQGRLIPGFEHNVARHNDTRTYSLKAHTQKYLSHDPLAKLINKVAKMAPILLRRYSELKTPHQNVYCYSGLILKSTGIKDPDFNTVCAAISRSIGALINQIWDRALGLPIERPSSIDLKWIEHYVVDDQKKKQQRHDI